MANSSILAAFERMWQHITTRLESQSAAHIEYTDNAVANAVPDPTTATEGAFLSIVNGKSTWVAVGNAEDNTFPQ